MIDAPLHFIVGTLLFSCHLQCSTKTRPLHPSCFKPIITATTALHPSITHPRKGQNILQTKLPLSTTVLLFFLLFELGRKSEEHANGTVLCLGAILYIAKPVLGSKAGR